MRVRSLLVSFASVLVKNRTLICGGILVSCVGVLLGAIFLYLAMTTPLDQPNRFFLLMCLTAVFMPLSSANVIATVYDVTVPEVRSTAQAIEYFIENSGARSPRPPSPAR